MENKGVIFNFESEMNYPNSFTITINGDHSEYIATITSLLEILGRVPDGECFQSDRNYINTLIIGMLPSVKQMETIVTEQKNAIAESQSDMILIGQKQKIKK